MFWMDNYRDGFYEILRVWERHHMVPGWSFTEVLGGKVRAMVSTKTELSNHLHFARLFQSQLIAVRKTHFSPLLLALLFFVLDNKFNLQMCKGDSSGMVETGDEDVALLSQLKRSNPEKFKK